MTEEIKQEDKKVNPIEVVEKEIQVILEKNKLVISYQISFPIYKILPDEVTLSLMILRKHGMKITTILIEKEQ